ncbi:MAG: class I SAM-dependent methyltransferase [Kiloniellales bacterium]
MDRHVYARMAAVEGRHWWFVARRRILADALRHLVALPEGIRILEAGCGTGGNLGMLAEFGEVHAFEPNDEAREYARRTGGYDIRPGMLPDQIPFDCCSYELVAALDILEHVDDDVESLRQLLRQLRPGGWAVVTVPAFTFLWSRHDELHHHKRRYRKSELRAKLRDAGFAGIQVNYFNTILFPLVVAMRSFKKLLRADNDDSALPTSALLNKVLCIVLASERFLVRRLPLPFGVSLLAVARRPAA